MLASLLRCEMCAFASNNCSQFEWHKQLHSYEKPFLCCDCTYSCKTQSALFLHRKEYHSQNNFFPIQSVACALCACILFVFCFLMNGV